MPTLSIIMPTYNRLGRLRLALAALERQTYPRNDMEIIIVSDGCSDGTDEYLRQMGPALGIIPAFQPNGGVATARNHGLQLAHGEWVLFLDDDIVATPTLAAEHKAAQSKYGDDVVVLGSTLAPPDFKLSPWVLWEQLMLNKQYDNMASGRWTPTARQFYTCNVSLRREHLLRAGGFDSAFRRAEDVELGYRLAEMGLKFVFIPQAAAYHYAERSFRSWLQTPYTYGRNDVIFTRKKGQAWLLPRILQEYHHRKWPVRALARVCLDHPALSTLTINFMQGIARIAAFLRMSAIPRVIYSGIFNLRHYQGIADELGGRGAFFSAVEKSRQAPDVNEPFTAKVNS